MEKPVFKKTPPQKPSCPIEPEKFLLHSKIVQNKFKNINDMMRIFSEFQKEVPDALEITLFEGSYEDDDVHLVIYYKTAVENYDLFLEEFNKNKKQYKIDLEKFNKEMDEYKLELSKYVESMKKYDSWKNKNKKLENKKLEKNVKNILKYIEGGGKDIETIKKIINS